MGTRRPGVAGIFGGWKPMEGGGGGGGGGRGGGGRQPNGQLSAPTLNEVMPLGGCVNEVMPFGGRTGRAGEATPGPRRDEFGGLHRSGTKATSSGVRGQVPEWEQGPAWGQQWSAGEKPLEPDAPEVESWVVDGSGRKPAGWHPNFGFRRFLHKALLLDCHTVNNLSYGGVGSHAEDNTWYDPTFNQGLGRRKARPRNIKSQSPTSYSCMPPPSAHFVSMPTRSMTASYAATPTFTQGMLPASPRRLVGSSALPSMMVASMATDGYYLPTGRSPGEGLAPGVPPFAFGGR